MRRNASDFTTSDRTASRRLVVRRGVRRLSARPPWGRRPLWVPYRTATRLAIVEHARNRLALLLVVFFVPIWLTMTYVVVSDEPQPFVLRATGETLRAEGSELVQISGAVNASTMIVGFMMFSATFTSGAFDQRLAIAGYPRTHLVLAKLSALVFVSAVIACYITTLCRLFWRPEQPGLLALGLFIAALVYGSIGVLLGAVLRGALEGMFLIIMASFIDPVLQNPLVNPEADSGGLRYLPTYGAMQVSTAAGYSDRVPLGHVGLQVLWFAGVAAVGLFAFHRRTRDRVVQGSSTAPGR